MPRAQGTLSAMPETDPVSAVVVRVSLPAAIERLRRRYDGNAAHGVPAHVTLLFPFLPVSELADTTRSALAEIARDVPPFDVRFGIIGRFPDVVYLVPEPSVPFASLTMSIAGRFPGFPPYAGAFQELVPHLTLADAREAPFEAIAASAARSLPFTRHVDAIEVLAQRLSGPWQRCWRIPLGIRP